MAAAPEASNSERSEASTSWGRQRRIIPIGRLTRPLEAPIERGLVILGRLLELVGRTIRCVERDDCATPGRLGLRPDPPRGMTIGCVVAALAGRPEVGIKPDGCGGLTAGMGPELGGV